MNKKALLEAAFFVSENPLSIEKISKMLNTSIPKAKKILNELIRDYGNRGMEIFESPQGYTMRVRKEYIEEVRHLTSYKDIPRAVLKTLSLIAYYQPIKQSRVVKIRGNRAYEQVKILVEKGLVNKDRDGRTFRLSTTKAFKEYFDLGPLEIEIDQGQEEQGEQGV